MGRRFSKNAAKPSFASGAPRSFEIVSALDVFFHLVDDNSYEKAIVNTSNLLDRGGFLLMSENLLQEEQKLMKKL